MMCFPKNAQKPQRKIVKTENHNAFCFFLSIFPLSNVFIIRTGRTEVKAHEKMIKTNYSNHNHKLFDDFCCFKFICSSKGTDRNCYSLNQWNNSKLCCQNEGQQLFPCHNDALKRQHHGRYVERLRHIKRRAVQNLYCHKRLDIHPKDNRNHRRCPCDAAVCYEDMLVPAICTFLLFFRQSRKQQDFK